MKAWTKYLVIGWSIICVGITIVSFQIMKNDYIQEDYDIFLPLRVPEKLEGGLEFMGPLIYADEKEKFLSKEQFIERAKGAKSIELRGTSKVKNKAIYLYLPIYAFVVWALPILMFVLVGNLFGKTRLSTMRNGS